jgi:hypothetical protein
MINIENKLFKIILATMIIIAIFNITNNVNAETIVKTKQILNGNNGQVTFKQVDIDTIQTGPINPDSGMNTMISKIFGVVQYCCIAAAVIIVITSGVKYMASEPEQKAEIKKQAIALVIGAAIIFSISTILRIIANVTRTSIQ